MAALSSDALLAGFARIRQTRDKIREARDGCFCLRAEPHQAPLDDDLKSVGYFEPKPEQVEPCWKAARKWDADGDGRFYLDPPISDWCEPCRQRQAYTEQLRAAVREHGGALRGLLRRGRTLAQKAGR